MTTAEQNTEELPDLTEALASISADLFPGVEADESEVASEDPPVGETVPADGVVAEVVEPSPQTTEPDPADTPPTTWTKEAIAEWATIPPKAKAEILKREGDMFRGIEQYKEKAAVGTAYDSVVEPYRAVLAAENINPVDLFKAFAGNHYLLSRGTPEQKIDIAVNLLKAYGIDANTVADRIGAPAEYVDPTIAQLQARIAQLEGATNQQVQSAREAERARINSEVESFYSDPKNIYAAELVDDIALLLRTGAETTLPAAYQTAIFRNPVTREKEMARLQTEAANLAKQASANRLAEVQKATSVNLSAKGKNLNGTVPVGSLDDTLAETMAAIAARS